MKRMEPARLIQYGAELTSARVWQEAALVALGKIMQAHPPSPEEIDESPEGVDAYAKRVSRAAYAIADEFEIQHGPCLSEYLQSESRFELAERAKAQDGE